MGKQLSFDDNAYYILAFVKTKLNKIGISGPSFGDAVRYLVENNVDIKEFREGAFKFYQDEEKKRKEEENIMRYVK